MKLIKRIAFGSAGLLVLMMILATVLEKIQGTDTAWSAIYGSPLFTTIWGIMAICAFAYLIHRKLQRDFFTFLLHTAFLIILTGALTTRLCGKQGSIHLRMNDAPASAFITSGQNKEPLPFQVQLHDFRIDYYKGSFAPMDFTSRIRIDNNGTQTEGEVSMNRIFTYRHYRFYQSAYDKDGRGTTLAVSYDPWGIGITYTGYALLLLSILGFFFQKDSMFRRLLSHPALHNKTAILCIALSSFLPGMASEAPKHLSREAASEIGNLYIYYHDRICPLQTLAKDFTMKLYGKTNYKGLTSEQVFTGWFFYYDDWKAEPVIRIKSKEIQHALGIKGQYASLNDFFGTEGYKLKDNKEINETKYKRELNEANEKFNLISMTATGSILKIYPCRTEHNRISWFAPVDDLPQDLPDDQWLFVRKSLGLLSEQVMKKDDAAIIGLTDKIREYQQKTALEVLPSNARFNAEKLYNRLDYTKPLAMACLTIGILSFLFYCRRVSRPLYGKTRLHIFPLIALGIISLYLITLISLRGFVSGHLPLSNGYETMLFMAFCVTLLTFLFYRKLKAVIAFGYMLCGLALLVAMLGEANPPITGDHYDSLLAHCIYYAERHHGDCLTPYPKGLSGCYRPPASHQPDYPLSGSVLPGSRHLHRCRMGKRFMGTLLGMGPERDMGAPHYLINIYSSLAPCIAPRIPASDVLPLVCRHRFPKCVDYLFRGQLHFRRNAWLCINYSIICFYLSFSRE